MSWLAFSYLELADAPISSRFYSNSLYSQISLPPSSSTPLICFYFLPLFLSIGANFCYTPVVRQSPYSVQEFPCFLLFVSTKPAFSRVKNHVSPYSVVRLVLHFLDQRRFFYWCQLSIRSLLFPSPYGPTVLVPLSPMTRALPRYYLRSSE